MQQRKSVEIRHHHVAQDQIRRVAAGRGQGRAPIRYGLDLISGI